MSTLTAERPDSIEQRWINAQPDDLRSHVAAWRTAHKHGDDVAAERELAAIDNVLANRGN
jgi:hypothetical protein